MQNDKEYWVNVYAWFNSHTGKYQYFAGSGLNQKFPTRNHAAYYQPSIGLEVHYRIHVKMDGGYNRRKTVRIRLPNEYRVTDKNILNKMNWMG